MTSMLSVPVFLSEHGLSRSLFYRLVKEGRGPRLTKIGRRTLISSEAAAEWRTRMERETAQAASL
jgi:predicted DNA-binding transcriptional regulator AlpA